MVLAWVAYLAAEVDLKDLTPNALSLDQERLEDEMVFQLVQMNPRPAAGRLLAMSHELGVLPRGPELVTSAC